MCLDWMGGWVNETVVRMKTTATLALTSYFPWDRYMPRLSSQEQESATRTVYLLSSIPLTTKLCSPVSITPLAFLTLLFLGFGRTSFTALRLFLWTETLFPPSVMICEVPQGSVQGPFLFVRYTQPLSDVVHHHSLSSHSFSADNQLYKSGHI